MAEWKKLKATDVGTVVRFLVRRDFSFLRFIIIGKSDTKVIPLLSRKLGWPSALNDGHDTSGP